MSGSTSNFLSLIASLSAAPSAASDGQFPSGVTSIPFTLNAGSEPKPAPVQTGVQFMSLASPLAFTTLAGVPSSVAKANTVYLRTDAKTEFRFTYLDATTSTLHAVMGLCLFEVDDSNPIVLIEAQGTSQIEFFVSGDSA